MTDFLGETFRREHSRDTLKKKSLAQIPDTVVQKLLYDKIKSVMKECRKDVLDKGHNYCDFYNDNEHIKKLVIDHFEGRGFTVTERPKGLYDVVRPRISWEKENKSWWRSLWS